MSNRETVQKKKKWFTTIFLPT